MGEERKIIMHVAEYYKEGKKDKITQIWDFFCKL